MCLLNATYKHTCYLVHIHMTQHMPHINPMHTAMWPGTELYIHFTLAYDPQWICLPHHTNMSHCTTTMAYI